MAGRALSAEEVREGRAWLLLAENRGENKTRAFGPRTMSLVGFGEKERAVEEQRCQTRQTSILPRRHSPNNNLPFSCIFSLLTIIMAALRLRKAFRYPEDSDEDREELDEEEQEQVIQQLQRQNDARNAQYSVHTHSLSLNNHRPFSH